MIVPEDMMDATKTKDTAGESNAGGQQLLDQDEAIGLNRSNNAMSKALNARKVKNSATNFGTNNALYSQELRRYLRLRKQWIGLYGGSAYTGNGSAYTGGNC